MCISKSVRFYGDIWGTLQKHFLSSFHNNYNLYSPNLYNQNLHDQQWLIFLNFSLIYNSIPTYLQQLSPLASATHNINEYSSNLPGQTFSVTMTLCCSINILHDDVPLGFFLNTVLLQFYTNYSGKITYSEDLSYPSNLRCRCLSHL